MKNKKKLAPKEIFNHKATRKKLSIKPNGLESKQRSIRSYLKVQPISNNLIVGSSNEDNQDGPKDVI